MTTPAPEAPKPRATFIETFVKLMETAAADTLLAVPELAGLVIVPVWDLESPQAPSVMIRVPGNRNLTMTDLFRMEKGLLTAGQAIHPRLLQMLQGVDQEAARLAAEIRDRTQQLATASPPAGTAAPANPGGDSR